MNWDYVFGRYVGSLVLVWFEPKEKGNLVEVVVYSVDPVICPAIEIGFHVDLAAAKGGIGDKTDILV